MGSECRVVLRPDEVGGTNRDSRCAHEEHRPAARPPQRNHRPGSRYGELGCGHAPVVVASAVNIVSRYVLEVQEVGSSGHRYQPEQGGRQQGGRRNSVWPEPGSSPTGFARPEHQERGEREPRTRADEIPGPHRRHEDGERARQGEAPHREVRAAVRPYEDRYGPERQVLHRPDGVVDAMDDLTAVPDSAHGIRHDGNDQHGSNAVAPDSPQERGAPAPRSQIRQAVPRPG